MGPSRQGQERSGDNNRITGQKDRIERNSIFLIDSSSKNRHN